jgi:putative membrane protein
MTRLGFLTIALAASLAVGCNADNRTPTPDTTSNSGSVGTTGDTDRHEVNAADQNFANDLTIANMAEVELGKMAVDHSANAEVKKFGQMMIDDHTKAGEQLKSIASMHSIQVPTDLDAKHRELRDKLTNLKGAAFDREYMAAMAAGHAEVARTLESRIDKSGGTVVAQKSDDAVTMSLNQWAAEAYPVVQGHLKQARTINDAVKGRK